jgi:hypothetical protein
VAASDSLVPLRSDRGYESLDLMRSGRSRSGYTGSISDLICTARSRSDGRKNRERRCLLPRVPVRSPVRLWPRW